MTIKNAIILIVGLCCTVSLFSACQSSKIAYGNSYYFKATPKAPQAASAKSEIVTASVEESTQPISSVSLEKSREVINQRIISVQTHQKRMEEFKEEAATATSTEAKKVFQKQQRAERRAFRRDVKKLTKEIRQAPDEVQKEYLSSNGRLGLILAAIGLVLLLVVPGQIGYILGTILLVVGILLLILDLV